MQLLAISTMSFRFKRWSRKSYAVFATLGKAVTIGKLRVHMAISILLKPEVRLIPDNISENHSEFEIQEDEFAAQNAQLLTAIPVITNTYTDAAAPAVINIYSFEPRSEQFILFRPWFFNSFLFIHPFNFYYA